MQRRSGILLHPTSLPGPQGIGTLGDNALTFVDFLAETRQSIWQTLPLGPTGYGDSPYNALSAFAGNPMLIDHVRLIDVGDLSPAELELDDSAFDQVDYQRVRATADRCLARASERFFDKAEHDERRVAFKTFCQFNAGWLDDFALFMAIREDCNATAWQDWPEALRERDSAALVEARHKLKGRIRAHSYQQFVFHEQWTALKRAANDKGIRLFGDIPIFVAFDSAEVWAHQELFHLDQHGRPNVVAGVPPDYFSATGQRWGNPLYRWERHAENRYRWWTDRFQHQAQLFDMLRVDHFRGFQACWVVPATEQTAINGHWEEVPGRVLFKNLRSALPELEIVAEDLGIITPEVEALRDDFDFPGMRILQFAFDSGPDNPYLPHNHRRNAVVYTGTHDNDTTLGWWQSLPPDMKDKVREYLGDKSPDIPWDLIRLAMSSVARTCIIPCQDLLSLGKAARFNRPGRATGNWTWRLTDGQLDRETIECLQRLTIRYNRA